MVFAQLHSEPPKSNRNIVVAKLGASPQIALFQSAASERPNQTPTIVCAEPSTSRHVGTTFTPPEAWNANGKWSLNLKEFIMDKQVQAAQEPQFIDLGDAKELTQGLPQPNSYEDSVEIEGKKVP